MAAKKIAWILQVRLADAQLAYEQRRSKLTQTCKSRAELTLAESSDRECALLLGETGAISSLMQMLKVTPDDSLADAKQAQRLRDATRARLMLAELERTTI